MSSPPEAPDVRAACSLLSALPDSEALADVDVQALLGAAVRLYADRVASREEPLPAFPADMPVTATDAMIAVSAVLKAVNIQVFELGMWQQWSGR